MLAWQELFVTIRELIDTESADAIKRLNAVLSQVAGERRAWLLDRGADTCVQDAAAPTCLADHADTILAPWRDQLEAGTPVLVDTGDAAQTADATRRLALECLRTHGVEECVLVPAAPAHALPGALCVEGAVPAPDRLVILSELAGLSLALLSRDRRAVAHVKSVNRLDAITRALPMLLFEVDEAGLYTGFCKGPPELMLSPPETLTGQSLTGIAPPEVLPVLQQALRETIATGHVNDISYSLDLPVGRRTFELCGARRAPARPGDAMNAVFLVRDTTERHEREAQMRRLERVVQAMDNFVFILDPDLRIEWVNPAYERFSGWTLDEIRNRTITELTRCPETDPAVIAALNLAISEKRAFQGQNVNCDRHGNRYWVDFNVQPLFLADGSLEGWVSIETDITPLKRQEATSRELSRLAEIDRQRLVNALDALPEAAAVYDADRRLVTLNPTFREKFPEFAAASEAGMTMRDIFRQVAAGGHYGAPGPGPERDEWIDTQLARFEDGTASQDLEHPDGRSFHMVKSATSDGGLVVLGIETTMQKRHVAALNDLNTELIHALDERNKARRELTDTMRAAQVGTWELDFATDMMRIGKHWSEMLGYGSMLSRGFSAAWLQKIIHPEDAQLFRQEHVLRPEFGTRTFEFEMRLRHRDGHWIWVLSRGKVTKRDRRGAPLLAMGVYLDISEQKSLRAEVETGQAHLRLAMENSNAAVILFDHDARLVFHNAEAERLIGVRHGMLADNRERLLPWHFETLDGTPMEPDRTPYARALNGEGPLQDYRHAIRWDDGRRQVISCNAVAIEDSEGRRNVVLSFRDITDELDTTLRLEAALAHAEETSRAKSVFLANMSHEIRTPLNGVLGLAEVLGMQLSDPEQQRMIASIRRSGETLLSVLNAILDMSKIEAGKMALESVPFSIEDILSEIEMIYAAQADEKGLEFDVFASTDCRALRHGDPVRIRQILHNLLNNAIKFTARGSVVLDVCCRDEKPVVFRITDTGCGMTREQAERVFAAFEQAETGTTRRYGGTGLGLPIARQLAVMMGGDITMDSQPGRGTVMTLTLPLCGGDGERGRGPGTAGQATDAGQEGSRLPAPPAMPSLSMAAR